MKISAKVAQVGTSIFTEMTVLAREVGALNLSQGFPDFDGPDWIKELACRAVREGPNQYERSAGRPRLVAAIARHLEESYGLEVDPMAEITVTSGATEGIYATLTGLLDPGCEVVCFEPFYDSYPAVAGFAGATIRTVPLRAPDFSFDEEALAAAFSERTRAVLVNTPHNPTGKVFSRAELEAIVALCAHHDAWLISDEVYEHMVYEGEHVSPATLAPERTVLISSAAKTFSFTGWKVGWVVAPPLATRAVRAVHQFTTFCSAAPFQEALAQALEEAPGRGYYAGLREAYRERRDVLVAGLREIGFRLEAPAGTYFAMADYSPFSRGDDKSFAIALARRHGVATIPPSSFYQHPESAGTLVRFAFCKGVATLREAVRKLSGLRGGL